MGAIVGDGDGAFAEGTLKIETTADSELFRISLKYDKPSVLSVKPR